MMNDKTKLVKENVKEVKEAKKRQSQVVVVGPPIEKRFGKMGLGEMLPNRFSVDGYIHIRRRLSCVQGAAEKSSPLKFFAVFSATV